MTTTQTRSAANVHSAIAQLAAAIRRASTARSSMAMRLRSRA